MVLVSTMYLWGARLLVQSTRQSNGLARDAQFRSSAAHTFVALTKEVGTIDDAGKRIVMEALFKSPNDASTTDDGMPPHITKPLTE